MSIAGHKPFSHNGSQYKPVVFEFNHNKNLIINGIFPSEGTHWQNSQNVWWNGTGTQFTIDLGPIHTVDNLSTSVDNNDTYQIEYSVNNITFSHLFTISAGAGNITPSAGGMDTFFASEINFSPVSARYLKIRAISEDNSYSIGELAAFGTLLSPILTTRPANGGTLNFANVWVTTTGNQSITAQNTGSSTLIGTFPAASGEFGPGSSSGFSLSSGQSTARNYTYTPNARGSDNQSRRVTSNGGNSMINLAGTGVGPVYTSTFGASSTLNFGNIVGFLQWDAQSNR